MKKIILWLNRAPVPLWQVKVMESLAVSGSFEVEVEYIPARIMPGGVAAFLKWAETEKLIRKIPGDLMQKTEIPPGFLLKKEAETVCSIWLDFTPPPPDYEGIYLIHDVFYYEKETFPAFFHPEIPYIKTSVFYQQKNGDTFLLREAKSYAGNLSASLNLHVITGKSIALIHRVLGENPSGAEHSLPVTPEFHSLSTKTMLNQLVLQFRRRLRQFFDRRKHRPTWQLLYQITELSFCDFDPEKLTLLASPDKSLNADPFIFTYNQKTFVFFEEIPDGSTKGRISVTEWLEDDTFSDPVCVLQAPFHLSFPYVFEYENRIYMIPETQENRTISLYEAEDFPYTWKLKKHLMENTEAGDTVVFSQRDKWWMMTSVKDIHRPEFPENHAVLDELSVFYTEDLLEGEWKAHAGNPVLSDITQSLNGGKIFHEEGRLYRVAQCGSPYYGYRIEIFEITHLSEFSFEQRLVRTLSPPYPLRGMHTFCKEGNRILMDGLM
ncbi:MAG: hypothetical protein K1X92_05345 [Bacteroidia bacterium]|nr:hypothetical protein [Bacteroidia bacterium]